MATCDTCPGGHREETEKPKEDKAKQPKCCVCGTTENLREDGWHGHRCDSPDCICF